MASAEKENGHSEIPAPDEDNLDQERRLRGELLRFAAEKESEAKEREAPFKQFRVVSHVTSLEANINLVISARTELGAIVAYTERNDRLNIGGSEDLTYSYHALYFQESEGQALEGYLCDLIREAFDGDLDTHFFELGKPEFVTAPQIETTKSVKKC